MAWGIGNLQPINVNNWTVNSGVVNAPCPTTAFIDSTASTTTSNITCDEVVIDDGFMQRRVTVDGESIYQFIVVEPGTTGDPKAALDFSANTLPFSHESLTRTQTSSPITNNDFSENSQTNLATSSTIAGIESRMALVTKNIDGPTITSANDGLFVNAYQKIEIIDWNQATPETILEQDFFMEGGSGQPFVGGESYHSMTFVKQTMAMGGGDQQGFIAENGQLATYFPNTTENGVWVGQTRANPTVNFTPFSNTRYTDSTGTEIKSISTTDANPDQASSFYNASGTRPVPDANIVAQADPAAAQLLNTLTGLVILGIITPAQFGTIAQSALSEHLIIDGYFTENFNLSRPAPTTWTNSVLPGLSGVLTDSQIVDALGSSLYLDSSGNPLYLSNEDRSVANITNSAAATTNGGSPTALNQWTIANGVITAPCPLGAVCDSEVGTGGWLVRGIIINGVEYRQSIITESGATGDPSIASVQMPFYSETFTRVGATGVASSTSIYEVETSLTAPDVTLDYTTAINNGWALPNSTDAALIIDSQITIGPNSNLVSSSPLASIIGFDMLKTGAGAKDYTVFSELGYSGPSGGFFGTSPRTFYSRTIEGALQSTSRALDPLNPLLPGGGASFTGNGTGANCDFGTSVTAINSGTTYTMPWKCGGSAPAADLAWSAGDTLQATHIGSGWLLFMRSSSPPTGLTGHDDQSITAITNLTTGDRAQVTKLGTGITASGPWSSPFDMPTLPDTYQPTF